MIWNSIIKANCSPRSRELGDSYFVEYPEQSCECMAVTEVTAVKALSEPAMSLIRVHSFVEMFTASALDQSRHYI